MSGPTPHSSFILTQERDAALQKIRSPVTTELERVEEEILGFFDAPSRLLTDLASHITAMPGKKFRPTLLLLVTGLGGHIPSSAIRAAAMVELIHMATLIHDDTIDQSLVRRGLPTINSLWNDNVSTILGDYLFTRAFHNLVEREEWPAVSALSRTAHQMTLGEMLGIEQKGDLELSEADYHRLISEKTASLISAACEIGAAIAFEDPRQRTRFHEFGYELGMAYQVTDDLFDYYGDADALGKEIGTDLREGKITLPVIRALRDAPDSIYRLVSEVVERREITREAWERLTAHLAESGAFAYCREQAAEWAERARSRLDGLPSSPYTEALELAVDFATQRSH